MRPRCTSLSRLVTTPASMRVDESVGEHLGVDAQVVLVVQAREHGVGDAADAHLERRSRPRRAPRRSRRCGPRLRLAGPARTRAGAGRSAMKASTRSSGTTVLPCVRGICSLISAMTSRAESAAALAASTEVPSVHSRGGRAAKAAPARRRAGRAPTEQARDVGEEDRHEVGAAFLDGPAQRAAR